MCPIHRLAAHDNSVTSLQFDDTRILSGGSDGRVKIWDLKTGQLVRELIAQGEAVWRVAFEDEKCVALALRQGRTVMEVCCPRIFLNFFSLIRTPLMTNFRSGRFLHPKRCCMTVHFYSSSNLWKRDQTDRTAPWGSTIESRPKHSQAVIGTPWLATAPKHQDLQPLHPELVPSPFSMETSYGSHHLAHIEVYMEDLPYSTNLDID